MGHPHLFLSEAERVGHQEDFADERRWFFWFGDRKPPLKLRLNGHPRGVFSVELLAPARTDKGYFEFLAYWPRPTIRLRSERALSLRDKGPGTQLSWRIAVLQLRDSFGKGIELVVYDV